jgi:DNA-directed RNA polymerase subunit L
MWQLEADESDEVVMSRYRQEHPNEVQAEYEFFAARNAAEKKIEEKKEEELKEIMWQIDAHESDEVAMARYREEHPEEV